MLTGFDASKKAGLWHARRHYFEYRNLDLVSEKYIDWVKQDQYLLLRNKEDNTYSFRKCSKRGNEYYRKRTWSKYRRLYELSKTMPPKKERSYSSFAFATFTYAERSIDITMNRVSRDWNRYITGMRKRYGRISAVRCYECQADGIVHIHAILVFHDSRFKTFLHGKKRRFEKKDEMSELWTKEHGFTDFFALNSWKHSLNYLAKYFMKDLELSTQKEIQSTTLLWIYKKRTYAVSRRLESHCVTQTKKGQFELIAIGVCTNKSIDLSKITVQRIVKWDTMFDVFLTIASPMLS